MNRRELTLAAGLLPERGQILDLACGTGRLARFLAERGRRTFVLDVSAPMLELARAGGATEPVLGDAFTTPFADGSFDGVAALRLAFHYRELAGLLAEMRRIVRPGGLLVFDTCAYSPRAVVPLMPEQWGGGVHRHPTATVRETAARLDLGVVSVHAGFFGSPYVYRLLPEPFVALLEAVERVAPAFLLSRVYWQVRREAAGTGQ